MLLTGGCLDRGGVLRQEVVRPLGGVEGDGDDVITGTDDHRGGGDEAFSQVSVSGYDQGSHGREPFPSRLPPRIGEAWATATYVSW